MKLMPCPLNGLRNINEFVCLGPVKTMPSPDAESRQWADYIFIDDNIAGAVREWWQHVPSAFWFIAERDTRSGDILRTWTVDAYAQECGL